jgi:phage terminase small subunit
MPKVNSSDGLTDRQRRFCEEYLIDFNATQAAIRAGYSKKAARQAGTETLSNPAVQKYLAEKKQKIADRLGFRQEDTIRGLIRIARADIRDVLDFGEEEIELPAEHDAEGNETKPARTVKRNYVRLKESASLSDDAAFPITGVSIKRDGSVSLRFADKKGALDTLARHQDLVKEALEVELKGRTLVEGAPNERDIARQVALLLAKGAAAVAAEPAPRAQAKAK